MAHRTFPTAHRGRRAVAAAVAVTVMTAGLLAGTGGGQQAAAAALPAATATTPPTKPPVKPPTSPVVRPKPIPATKPGPGFFGVHVSAVATGEWPDVPEGSVTSVRLWDTGTTWKQISPYAGAWDWSRLDAAVETARDNGAGVDLVLGTGPQWAAKNPWQWAAYGDGSASLPLKESDWVEYVAAVARRYQGKISTYETWNEGNLLIFWGGTAAELARLNSLAYRTIKGIDPRATVLAPSATLRGNGITWLTHYAQAGGFRYSDGINVHAYPKPEGTPEDAIGLLRRARDTLAARGVKLPVYDTEINYGMPVGGKGSRTELTQVQQSAFVARTYLLAQSERVARTYWYSWTNAPSLSVQMTQPGLPGLAGLPQGTRNAPPAQAFVVVSGWLKGSMAPCTVDGSGTYACTIRYSRGTGVVRWNPKANVSVKAPAYTTTRQDVYGKVTRTRAGSRVRVGIAPVLFRTTR